MKKIFLQASRIIVLIVSLTHHLFAQDNTASTLRMGPFNLGLSIEQVNSIANRNISYEAVTAIVDDYEKFIKVTVAGVEYQLFFQKEYLNAPEPIIKEKEKYTVSRIQCSNASIKTKSGIAIGMNKIDVFKILDQQNLDYTYTKFSVLDENEKKIEKVYEYINISEKKTGKTLSMQLKNGIIQSFSLEYGNEGC